jgi:hypothetical protein
MRSEPSRRQRRIMRFVTGTVVLFLLSFQTASPLSNSDEPEINDAHFHLTNYIHKGTDIHGFLAIMGNLEVAF